MDQIPSQKLIFAQLVNKLPPPAPPIMDPVVHFVFAKARWALFNISYHNDVYDELISLRPNPKQEDRPLSAARDCFLNIMYSQLASISGGRLPRRSLRTRHDEVTRSGKRCRWKEGEN
jgi:hypothetical protein